MISFIRKIGIVFSPSHNLFEDVLLHMMSKSLYDVVNTSKTIMQDSKWHSEGCVYNHTRLVVNRLHNKYFNINLILAGLFHDLGKIDTTEYNKNTYTAYNHEIKSIDYVLSHVDWISSVGGNVDIVLYIVKNHMRYKNLDKMRLSEQVKFTSDRHFNLLQQFNSADFGGIEPYCKELNKHNELFCKIRDFKRQQKNKKIISSKFNGQLIMNLYGFKGKELGDIMTKFKNTFCDFDRYALNNSHGKIMRDFNDFINQEKN